MRPLYGLLDDHNESNDPHDYYQDEDDSRNIQ
jgi:hypothetical protein